MEEEPLILNEEHNEIKKTNDNKPRVSPAARKMASEKKIDIQTIKGSGKNGLVLKEDVMRN